MKLYLVTSGDGRDGNEWQAYQIFFDRKNAVKWITDNQKWFEDYRVEEWESGDEPELDIPTEAEIRKLIDDYRLECPHVKNILFKVGRLEYFTRAVSALSANGYENVTVEFVEYGTIDSDDDEEGAEDE